MSEHAAETAREAPDKPESLHGPVSADNYWLLESFLRLAATDEQ
jgi:hypothetical protein